MSEKQVFEQWAILEIMGHQRFAGLVSEQSIGGASFVRIDVPESEDVPGFTKLFGASSIYCISPVSEQIARHMAATFHQRPVQPYELPSTPRLLASEQIGAEPFDDDDGHSY